MRPAEQELEIVVTLGLGGAVHAFSLVEGDFAQLVVYDYGVDALVPAAIARGVRHEFWVETLNIE